MSDTTAYEYDLGYGSKDELEVEGDYIREGTFRTVIGILVVLVIAVIITVQWATVEGQQARMSNQAAWEGPTAARLAKAEAEQMLSEYEVIDEEAGTYRIPIERAMSLEVMEAQAEDN
jgi:hypothetical protein